MQKRTIAALVALMVLLGAIPVLAHGGGSAGGYGDEKPILRDLVRAVRNSFEYQKPAQALADGYEPFAIPEDVGGTLLTIKGAEITCFDSPDGGMGVHYVRNIDENLSASDPEALVYKVGPNGGLRLVALEYLIPADLVDPEDPPMLFGEMFHPHPYLPVWILHVWVWKWNPSGMFADFNPNVPACPAA